MQYRYNEITCTNNSCFPTDLMRIEKRDRSTLGSSVASAKRIATDMQPSIIANSFCSCFLKMQRHSNSAKVDHFFLKPHNALTKIHQKQSSMTSVDPLQMCITKEIKKIFL